MPCVCMKEFDTVEPRAYRRTDVLRSPHVFNSLLSLTPANSFTHLTLKFKRFFDLVYRAVMAVHRSLFNNLVHIVNWVLERLILIIRISVLLMRLLTAIARTPKTRTGLT